MLPKVKNVNPAEIELENIFLVMDGLNFSKDTSAMIVGGKMKLTNLIAAGKIRAVKEQPKQNSKWKCNAADVLRYCRNMREKDRPKQKQDG